MRIKTLINSALIIMTLLIASAGIIVDADPTENPVNVSIITPDIVEMENNFDLTINISYVKDFDAAQFDVSFDQTIINITGVTAGKINNTNVPLGGWSFIDAGKIRIIVNIPGVSGISGEGYLAKIQFKTISPGTSNINLSDGILGDNLGHKIAAEWNNDTIQIEGSFYTIEIDVTGQGSVILNPDKLTYSHGSSVELTATAKSGWHFDHWAQDITGSTNPYIITMDINKTINAIFIQNGGGGENNTPVQPPNNDQDKVIANASQSEKFGYIGLQITFDGSKSTGNITSYKWDFGDGETGTGKITTHTYSLAKKYTVTLTVSAATESDIEIFEIIVTSLPNNPPIKPSLTGSKTGTNNVEYVYVAVSSDEDNDTLKYIFDWDDGTITTTEFLPQGTETTQEHVWNSAGRYVIKVTANDNKTNSKTLEYVVLIDTVIVGEIGYMTDNDADGIYDTFHSKDAETTVEKQTDGTYLIDTDEDDVFDKSYNPATMELTEYVDREEKSLPYDLILIIIGVISIIFVCLAIYLLKRHLHKSLRKTVSTSDNIQKQKTEITPNQENNEGKPSSQNKINVRCPQCSQIFSIEKSNETKIIKCSNCGKTGTANYN